LKPPGTMCVKLKYDEALSNVAFNFNLRHYNLDDPVSVIQRYVMPHVQPGDFVTVGRACQISLASSLDSIQLRDRGFIMRWMTWRALSTRP
jgi:hypothetical protein